MSGGRRARRGRSGGPRACSDGGAWKRYYRGALHRNRSAPMPDDVIPVDSATATVHAALRVKGLDHVVLRVADMGRAIAFYEQVLGDRKSTRLNSSHLVISYAVF